MSEFKSLEALIEAIERRTGPTPPGEYQAGAMAAYQVVLMWAKQLKAHLDANPPAAGPWQTGKPPREEAYLAWYHDCGHTNGGYPLVNDTHHVRPYPDLWTKINPPIDTAPAQCVDHDANRDEPEMGTPKEEEGEPYTWKDAFLEVDGYIKASYSFVGYVADHDTEYTVLEWVQKVLDETREKVDE
jgi:hypothetical protein